MRMSFCQGHTWTKLTESIQFIICHKTKENTKTTKHDESDQIKVCRFLTTSLLYALTKNKYQMNSFSYFLLFRCLSLDEFTQVVKTISTILV